MVIPPAPESPSGSSSGCHGRSFPGPSNRSHGWGAALAARDREGKQTAFHSSSPIPYKVHGGRARQMFRREVPEPGARWVLAKVVSVTGSRFECPRHLL